MVVVTYRAGPHLGVGRELEGVLREQLDQDRADREAKEKTKDTRHRCGRRGFGGSRPGQDPGGGARWSSPESRR